MATGPSPRVRQEFRKYLTNTVATEGEPAALGKSATGPVYYTDYDGVEHKNRVWFRKGSNKEIVGVARADNQGLPDVPNLPIRVARRFGSNWVVDWQRENPAVPTGGGGTGAINEYSFAAGDFGPAVEDTPGSVVLASFGSPLYAPVWVLPDAATNSIGSSFASAVSGTSVEVYVYWFVHLSATGNWRMTTAVNAEEAAERLSNYLGGTTQIEVLGNGATLHWELVITKHTHTIDVAEGDHVRITVARTGADASDTMTDDVNILGARVVIPDGEAAGGGATSTASGVHKFSPAAMLAAQNASETSVNSLATPAIAIPDSGATPTINVAFLAEKTSATLDIDIYAVTASGSGDVVLDADAYSGATDGTGTPTDNNGFVTDGTFAADGNIRKFSLTVAFTTQPDLAPGDYCSARIQRLVASGSDTLAADLHVLMIVVTENGDG